MKEEMAWNDGDNGEVAVPVGNSPLSFICLKFYSALKL